MNVLIFKTTNEKRLEEILKWLNKKENQIFLVLPHKGAEQYKRQYKAPILIETDMEYMDYHALKKENRIPNLCFDEVWVPSSFIDDFFSFGDIYAILTEIRYKKMIWIGSDNHKIIIKNDIQYKIKNRIYYFFSKKIFFIAKAGCTIYSVIKGYRW